MAVDIAINTLNVAVVHCQWQISAASAIGQLRQCLALQRCQARLLVFGSHAHHNELMAPLVEVPTESAQAVCTWTVGK